MNMNRGRAEEIAVAITIALFAMLLGGVVIWCNLVWANQVNYHRHPKHWYKEAAFVSDITPSTINVHSNNIATILYVDIHNTLHKVSTEVPKRVKQGESLAAYIRDNGRVFFPTGRDQDQGNPYRQRHTFFPAAAIVAVGVCGNGILCLCIGLLIEHLLMSDISISLPKWLRKRESVFGMQTLPKPRRVRLVHMPDGTFTEKEYYE